MVSQIEAQALRAAQQCKGFLDPDEGARLHDLAREHAGIGPIVEIGSYCGKSSCYLGAGARAGGGILICVDHHTGNEENQRGELYHDADLYDERAGRLDSLPFFRDTIRRAGLEDTVVIMVTRSARAAALLTAPPGMVFIDGGHTQAAADVDYECWAPKIPAGGVLAIHDLFPDPNQGGQAPINIYRRAVASGLFDELLTVKTLGILRRR